MRLTAHGTGVAVALPVAAALGVAGASVVTAGRAADPAPGGGPIVGAVQRGSVAADPAGGPPWAVRTYETQAGLQCAAAARTDGTAFGPADRAGRVRDVDPALMGSCDDPAEPLLLVLAQYADAPGAGARSVLFGVAGANVARILADDGSGRPRALAPDAARTFLLVREGLSATGSWTVAATLRDGSTRDYRR